MDIGAYRSMLDKIAAARHGAARAPRPRRRRRQRRRTTTDETVDKRKLGEAVAAAIETLPAQLVQVLALYYQEDCTLRQIGQVLGVSESRVSQLHTEAIHRLRAAVGRE